MTFMNNLTRSMLLVQAMEQTALELPPIETVIEDLDALEYDSERRGQTIPTASLTYVRPLLKALREFQNAVIENRRKLGAIDAETRAGGG